MGNAKVISKTAFNKQAKTYDYDIKGQHARMLYPYILEQIVGKSYMTILDLGCGTGKLLKMVMDLEPNIKAYGIDISENMLHLAKSQLQNTAELVLGDAEHLPYEKNKFDAIYCNDSFHHYPAPREVVSEVSRVLKPGGTFIIGDCWQPFGARSIMNFYMKHSNEGDVKIYSEKEISIILSSHFHEIKWTRINYNACMILCKNT